MASPPDICVVMGTYDRIAKLQACVDSIRHAVGKHSYIILPADGGSTDGTRDWLAIQPDCEMLEGGLDGAVKAFNVGFSRAVDIGSPFVCQFNDDLTFISPLVLERAVALLEAHAEFGAVAFSSDRYAPGVPGFINGRYYGKAYCNQGLFRREAGMAAARLLGDQEGKKWWNPVHHTYASDTELGLAIWRLGWTIHEALELAVHDGYTSELGHLDPLRQKNSDLYTTFDKFIARWPSAKSVEYSCEDAKRFGGRL